MKLEIEYAMGNAAIDGLDKQATALSGSAVGLQLLERRKSHRIGGGTAQFVCEYLLTVGTGVAVNVFSSWLYDKLASSKSTISVKIENLTVELDTDALAERIREIQARDANASTTKKPDAE